jgi:hypothetical protein
MQDRSKDVHPPHAQPAAALGVQEHEAGGIDVVLLEVKRTSGDTLTIKWQYNNKTNEKKKLDHGAQAGLDSYRFAGDAYYIDPGTGKKYTVLQDESRNPLGAKQVQFQFGITLTPKQVVPVWAKFQAPPAGVGKVTVYLPGAPPFEDVVVSQ